MSRQMIKNMFETYLNKNYEFNWNLKSRDKIYIYQEADGDAENQQLSKTFVLALFCHVFIATTSTIKGSIATKKKKCWKRFEHK